MERTVLILGANGRFGLAAAQAFTRAGWRVLAQVRRELAAGMPAGTVPVRVPLGSTAALAREAAGTRVVVYAASPPYARWATELLPLARAGMDAAQALGATFMLPGNIYNFGAGMPALLTEATPEAPSNDKGAQRCQLEAEMAARSHQGLHSVVLRAGDFFGSGSGSWFDLAIAKDVARGKLVYPGPLDRTHAFAYLPDLARAFVALAERSGASGFERFHFAGHTVTGAELLAATAAAAASLGLAPAQGWRHRTLPWGAMRLLAWANPTWRELLKMEYLWRVPHALDGTQLAQAIGLAGQALPTTPLADALRASLAALNVSPSRAVGELAPKPACGR